MKEDDEHSTKYRSYSFENFWLIIIVSRHDQQEKNEKRKGQNYKKTEDFV